MTRQEWMRSWLQKNAERVLRERTLERLFLDQFARAALEWLQDRKTVPELVRRLNASAPEIGIQLEDAWTVPRLSAQWSKDCAEAAMAAADEGLNLKGSDARRVARDWLARHGDAIAARAPRKWALPRPLATRRFMEFLVNKIRIGGRVMEAEAAGVEVGAELPAAARNCQIHLMRLLRSHAVLRSKDGDGVWRGAVLVDTWTGLGFSVDGIEDIPKAGPVSPAGPRRFELDTSQLPEARTHPALPLSEVLRELTIGFRERESAVHPWLREPSGLRPPEGAPSEVQLESGLVVPAATYQEMYRPHVVARYDLPAIASIVVTQTEGLVHQLAHSAGQPIPAIPRVQKSVEAIRSSRGLPADLLDRLSAFFREGLSSPRFRFAHGTLGDRFVRETYAIATEGVALWNDLITHFERTGGLSVRRADWWWARRGWWTHSIGFVRRFSDVHTASEEMIDHLFDVPKLLDDISPNHKPYWQLSTSCHRYPGCTHTSHWALAHIAVPMVEGVLRNLAEMFGFRVLKVGRRFDEYSFNVALLNDRELLSESFLATFWPDALRLRDGRRTLALFLRIRNALAHGEILALGLRGIDVVRFSLLVASILLWPVRLQRRA